MKTKSMAKLLIIGLTLLMVVLVPVVGCQEKDEPPSTAPAAGALSSTLVPNMNLDLYVYIKQERPTTLPAGTINVPFDIDVDSLALWIVSIDDDFAFGGAIALTSATQAEKVHSEISHRARPWTKLSGSTVYVVDGSGTAAESLKQAISSNDFKYYDDSQGLRAVSTLPDGERTKLAGVAVVKPSKKLIGFLARDASAEDLGMINTLLTVARLNVIAAGLYSPDQIDVAKLYATLETSGISNLDIGMVVSLKSGLPGFIVEPAVKKILTEAKFRESSAADLALYHGSIDTDMGPVPVLVRIKGNHVFAAVSGKESYARTLITSISK